MALLSIKREVDIMPGVSAPVVFHVSQGDVGTSVILGLLNNGASYTIPTGVTISIIGSASNGAVFTPVSATFSGSDVTFLLSEEMSAVAGPTLCEAVISLNNDVLGTANFIINVEASPMGGDVPPVFTDAAWLWMLNKMETEIVEDIETSPGTDATIINGINEALTTGRATQDALAETDERVDAVAPWFSSSSAYTEGDYVYLSTGSAIKLYRFTADHAAGAWTGTDVEEVTVSEELNRLEGSGSGKADELTIAPEFDTSASYTAGSYVLKNGVLYRFASDHSAGAWTGNDAVVVTVGGEVKGVNNAIYDMSEGYTWNNGYYALGTGVWTPQTGSVTYHSTEKINGKIPDDSDLIHSEYMSGDSFYPVWLDSTYQGYLMDGVWKRPNGNTYTTPPQYDNYAIVLHNVADYQGFRKVIYYKKSDLATLAKHSVLMGQTVQAGFSPETDTWTYGYLIRCAITTTQYAENDLYVHCADGYQVVVYYRNAQDEYTGQSGWKSNIFKIDSGTYYCLQFRKKNDSSVTPSEIINNVYISNSSDDAENYPVSKAIEYITIPKAAINALINLLNHVAYIDTHGQQYVNTLTAILNK